jgi:hypothetical protein
MANEVVSEFRFYKQIICRNIWRFVFFWQIKNDCINALNATKVPSIINFLFIFNYKFSSSDCVNEVAIVLVLTFHKPENNKQN